MQEMTKRYPVSFREAQKGSIEDEFQLAELANIWFWLIHQLLPSSIFEGASLDVQNSHRT
jgi:hypothetical protein